ncbi:MAG: TIGR03790 family protein, partial [Candidatus Micrarchaeota archaeon]|nr:TIGR03790 family protein [Candidatus Micrarchaeota archaeon]
MVDSLGLSIRLFIFLALFQLIFADYSDVLLVANNQSADSLAIADYFAANRPNLTHRLNVSMPNWWAMNFSQINATLFQPIRAYLNSSNGSGINYIVLTKDIPTVTNQTGCCPVFGLSVDSTVAVLNTAYESQIAASLSSSGGEIFNPYYRYSPTYDSICGQENFCPFSRSKFGIYLVTRLDGFNTSDVINMIDRSKSTSINRTARNSGNALLINTIGAFTSGLTSANATLSQAGMNTTVNLSYPPDSTLPRINYSNISYLDFYHYASFSPYGLPNFTFINGSLVSPRYSFGGRYTNISYKGTEVALAADLISQGATAAYACSKEPYVSGSNKPEVLAQNFIQGTYYADIIWNSIPRLAHSAVVFADPKAGPTAVHIDISPARLIPPYKNLSCNFTIYDNIRQAFNVTYSWYKNGTLQPAFSGQISNAVSEFEYKIEVPLQNVSPGEEWKCDLSLNSSGESLGNFSSKSTYVISEIISTCDQPLDVPGTTYNLSNSLYFYPSSKSTCIMISAPNVTLDCKGFSIISNNTSSTYGIYSEFNNTVIRNCVLSNFSYGVSLRVSENNLVENSSCSVSYGIYLDSVKNSKINNISTTSDFYLNFASINNT